MERVIGRATGFLLRRITGSRVQIGSLTFFVRRTDADAKSRPLSGFTVRQLKASDRDAVLFGSESGWEKLLGRFRAGDLCFGALDPQGRAVHTRWVTLTRAHVPELGMDFMPGPEAGYFYDGYTRPDARRHGVDGAVRAAIFDALQHLGRASVYSYVRNDNPEGLRAALRAQEIAARVRYVRLFTPRPFVFGATSMEAAALVRTGVSREDNVERRAAAWREWFEGWLKEPIAKRSIGFHQLPEEAFEAMARHIGATLSLDPARDSVLDVGCDSALVTRHVAKLCARLVGVDFIPGMLIDAQRARRTDSKAASPPRFAAADGRALPFPAGTFTKAYCTGVIHTLPSIEDGIAMILEIVRVLRPGGIALIAALPDTLKRGQARREVLRLGSAREKAEAVAAMVIPARVRRLARRFFPGPKSSALRYLEYDLRDLSIRLEQRGLACSVVDYPGDFWSRDFERTRSNLIIKVPRFSGDWKPGQLDPEDAAFAWNVAAADAAPRRFNSLGADRQAKSEA